MIKKNTSRPPYLHSVKKSCSVIRQCSLWLGNGKHGMAFFLTHSIVSGGCGNHTNCPQPKREGGTSLDVSEISQNPVEQVGTHHSIGTHHSMGPMKILPSFSSV